MAWNPLGFRTPQVTFWLVAIYIALFVPIVYFHLSVPGAPTSDKSLPSGLNLTEAWLDLKEISKGFHPYNSHRSDDVRLFLLSKIDQTLKRNNASSVIEKGAVVNTSAKKSVIVYDDLVSNATFGENGITVYFEGTNIMVQVIGSEADSLSGVLVNAHYDSVSTGYGVTDDGMGVVSILQLISHFSIPENQPKRSITFLLNNGEEDFLNGATAFMTHPLSKKPHIFLNLEGAGAGGKAVLFRSTDTEVTKFYKKAKYPTGSVVTGDGFKYRLVRSETDYAVFWGKFGKRGLDVAFFNPRSRYHTIEDSTKYDSVDSLWNMLEAALSTVQGMASDTSSRFDSESEDDKHPAGRGSDAVWFDIFSRAFVLLRLHTLFALSVSLLVVSPLILIALHAILNRLDKWYPFSRSVSLENGDTQHVVKLDGVRGFTRYPVAFVFSAAAVIGLAFLQRKLNPYQIYSSEFAVWSMFLSALLLVDWFIFYGAYQMRPTALARFYSLVWTYALAWLFVGANTVFENNFRLAGGYFFVIYLATTFVALLISYIEFFALPKKSQYAEDQVYPPGSAQSVQSGAHDEGEDDPTERTSLLRGERQTFSGGYGGRAQGEEDDDEGVMASQTLEGHIRKITGLDSDEQGWATKLPSWTWLIQLLLVAPINVILVGELGFYLTAGLHQTPADGNSVLTIYLIIALLSIMILNPLRPFLHKLSAYVPLVLLLVFAGTLAYNLLAFPFSTESKLKVYFLQRVDLDAGTNTVSLTGLDGYLQVIIAELPSAAGQSLNCSTSPLRAREGLRQCSWSGLQPNVVGNGNVSVSHVHASVKPRNLLQYEVTTSNNTAVFKISARNSRACSIRFDKPAAAVAVKGGSSDERIPQVGPDGSREVRLWHRDWDRVWEVSLRWDEADQRQQQHALEKGKLGVEGHVVCLWSDANTPGVIPALDEVWRFMPAWAMVTKGADGLVEGSKAFSI